LSGLLSVFYQTDRQKTALSSKNRKPGYPTGNLNLKMVLLSLLFVPVNVIVLQLAVA